jgi:hypothetical protein
VKLNYTSNLNLQAFFNALPEPDVGYVAKLSEDVYSAKLSSGLAVKVSESGAYKVGVS